jgi:hypothetical protein
MTGGIARSLKPARAPAPAPVVVAEPPVDEPDQPPVDESDDDVEKPDDVEEFADVPAEPEPAVPVVEASRIVRDDDLDDDPEEHFVTDDDDEISEPDAASGEARRPAD